MSTKVYLVTTGSYDSYRVVGAFSKRDTARAYVTLASIEHHGWVKDYQIESFTLDIESAARWHSVWTVGMLLSSGEVVEEPTCRMRFEIPQGSGSELVRRVPCYKNQAIVRAFSIISEADVMKHAVEGRQAALAKQKIYG